MKPVLQLFPALTLLVILFSSCNNYGDKVKKEHIEVYYKKGITKEMAQRTANFLYSLDTSFNVNSNQTKSIQVFKKSDTIIFRMIIPMESVSTINENNFYALANLLSDSVYHRAPVNIDLTDTAFNSLRVLPYKKISLP